MLVAGHVDAVTGLSFSSYINVEYSSVPCDDIVVMLMANFGVRLYGNGIMVSRKFAAQKPDAVRGFLHAYLKCLKDAVKDPAAATPSARKRSTHLPTVFGVVWSGPGGHGHAAIHHGTNSSALDLSASGWHSCGCPISPQRNAAFGKISVPGPDRIDNLLKVHI
jgi:NMT1/THI5 like